MATSDDHLPQYHLVRRYLPRHDGTIAFVWAHVSRTPAMNAAIMPEMLIISYTHLIITVKPATARLNHDQLIPPNNP